MFNLFSRGKATSPTPSSATTKKEEGDIAILVEDVLCNLETRSERHGGKGWPADATVVSYHSQMGIICVGTASGTVCAYGENFQYTTLSESESLKSRPVRKLVAFGTDNLLIGYEGCGLELVSLPTIAVTRYLEVGWNDASIEDLSALQVDDRTEGRIFVYVGTTAGNVYVIDMSGPAVCARVSDYVISYVESGFDPHTSVIATDIQLSPKEQKYIAISYWGTCDGAEVGAINIYNIAKHKPRRLLKIESGVKTVAWTPDGETAFIGTLAGDVYAVPMEKSLSVALLWSGAAKGIINTGSDGNTSTSSSAAGRATAGLRHGGSNVKNNSARGAASPIDISAYTRERDTAQLEDGEKCGIFVRQLAWLSADHAAPMGALFLLLGHHGLDLDHERQESVKAVVALAATGNKGAGDMQEVFCVPLSSFEDHEVMSLQIIPTLRGPTVGKPKFRANIGGGIAGMTGPHTGIKLAHTTSVDSAPEQTSAPGLLIAVRHNRSALNSGVGSDSHDGDTHDSQDRMRDRNKDKEGKSREKERRFGNDDVSGHSSHSSTGVGDRVSDRSIQTLEGLVPNLSLNRRPHAGAGILSCASSGLQLRTIPCPSGTNVNEWFLEMGSAVTSEPVHQVLPPSDGVTAIAGMSPCFTPYSVASILLNTESSTGGGPGKGQSGSTDDIFSPVGSCNVVLARGRDDDSENAKRRSKDVVLLGHWDGYISCWGVSIPPPSTSRPQSPDQGVYTPTTKGLSSVESRASAEKGLFSKFHSGKSPVTTPTKDSMITGAGNFSPRGLENDGLTSPTSALSAGFLAEGKCPDWHQVYTLKCSELPCAVTAIATTEEGGLLAAGSQDGDVVVWETYDSMVAAKLKGEKGAVVSAGAGGFSSSTSSSEGITDGFINYTIQTQVHAAEVEQKKRTAAKRTELIREGLSFDDDAEDDDEDDDDDDDDDGPDLHTAQKSRPVPKDVNKGGRHSAPAPASTEASILSKIRVEVNALPAVTNRPFKPNRIREAYRWHVPTAVTSLSLVEDSLLLFVGTAGGDVYVCKGLGTFQLTVMNTDAMWRGPLPKSSVAGFVFSSYSCPEGPIVPVPALYVVYSCGSIGVISLELEEVVAYTLAPPRDGAAETARSVRENSTMESSANFMGAASAVGRRQVAAGCLVEPNGALLPTPSIDIAAYIENRKAIRRSSGGIGSGTILSNVDVLDALSEEGAAPKARRRSLTQLENVVGAVRFLTRTPGKNEPAPAPATSDEIQAAAEAAAARFESPASGGSGNSSGLTKARTDIGFSTPSSEPKLIFRCKGANDGTSTAASTPNSSATSAPPPSATLMVVVGGQLHSYDVAKFTVAVSRNDKGSASSWAKGFRGRAGSVSVESRTECDPLLDTKLISSNSLVAGRLLSYMDESGQFSGRLANAPALVCLDQAGLLVTVSVKSRKNVAHAELIDRNDELDKAAGAKDISCQLSDGVVLSNGNCYMLQSTGLLILSAACVSHTHVICPPVPLPGAAKIIVTPPPASMLMDTSKAPATKKRSMSVMSVLTSVPVDLTKVFSKSRDAGSEAKMTGRKGVVAISAADIRATLSSDVDEDDEECVEVVNPSTAASTPTSNNFTSGFTSPIRRLSGTSSSMAASIAAATAMASSLERDSGAADSAPRSSRDRSASVDLFGASRVKGDKNAATATASSGAAANDMRDALMNLERRGAMLQQMANTGDNLKEGAKDFRDVAKAQKEALRAKAARWGIF